MSSRSLFQVMLATALVGLMSACTSDSNSKPTPSNGDGGEAGTNASAGKGGAGEGGGKVDGGGTAGTSANTKDGGGNDGDDAGGEVVMDSGRTETPMDAGSQCYDESTGCFKSDTCPPKYINDLLNACTDLVCNPYDNSALTKLNSDGTLPTPIP